MPDLSVQIGSMLTFQDPRKKDSHRLLLKFVERLDTLTTHVNPAYLRAKYQGRRIDPAVEKIRLLSELEDGVLGVPRGCLGEVRQAAQQIGISLIWDSQIKVNGVQPKTYQEIEREVSARTGRPFQFRSEYQPEIIRSILQKRQGMIVLPCGGGKTLTGVAAALSSGEATLILVHTEDLLHQWIASIRFLTGRDPRFIGGGRHDYRSLQPGEFMVGMAQSISPNLKDYRQLLGSVGFLLVDECHRAPADLFAQIINQCQGRYRIGLSATPNRADGFGFLINALIGPTLYRLPNGATDLIRWGYLRRPLVIPVLSPFTPSEWSQEWWICCPDCEADSKRARKSTQLLSSNQDKQAFREGRLLCARKGRVSRCQYKFSGSELISPGKLILAQVWTEAAASPARLQLLTELFRAGDRTGRVALGLLNRKDGVMAVEKELLQRGMRAKGVTSETEARDAVLSGVRSGRYQALIATQLADEGLDIPNLDLLIMASAGRHDGTAQQRLGRICRPAGKEVPVCFDLVDDYSSARSQWRERAAAYRDAYGPECLPTDRPVSLAVAQRVLSALEEGVSLDRIRSGLSNYRTAKK